MLELRDYQSDAKAALYDYLRRKDGNPCVVIPTAGGKSICIASVAADAVNVWRGRVLILAHVKELARPDVTCHESFVTIERCHDDEFDLAAVEQL